MIADRLAKDALFEALASVAKAIGNGRRAEIVDVLAQGERSVEQLAEQIGQSIANTSQHLQVLARGGLVRTRRDGARVIYRLASDDVAGLWESIRLVATRHVASVRVLADEYLGDRSEIESLSAQQLHDRLQNGSVVVLDVRPPNEFDSGHIAGARSAPIDELAAIADSLPASSLVVAYCRGPYCVYADDAVRILTERGHVSARLASGYVQWKHAGLPVTTPTQASA